MMINRNGTFKSVEGLGGARSLGQNITARSLHGRSRNLKNTHTNTARNEKCLYKRG